MRGTVTALRSPRPIGEMLPSVYLEDPFAQAFTAGLDEVLAPVFATLDSLAAYVDPWLAPEDFLPWLAGWVGVAVDENWPVEARRALVARAVGLFRMRGTVAGLRAHVAVLAAGDVEIADSGGVSASARPGGTAGADGDPERAGPPRVTVRVRPPAGDGTGAPGQTARVGVGALNALVAAAKPAHVVHEVEVTGQ